MSKLKFKRKEVEEIDASTIIPAGDVLTDTSAGKTSKVRQFLVCALKRHFKILYHGDEKKAGKATWEFLKQTDIELRIT